MFRKPGFTGNELAKHIIVISIDALSETDWEEIQDLPNLSNLLKNGSYTRSLKSVFPTHTYTVHTTIVTGVYPDKHGIIQNHQFQPFIPENEQTWYWYQSEIKAPTIYDLARKHHMKTAGILWPVTGKSSLNYNFPEILAINNENQALKIFKNGSLQFMISLECRLGKYRKSIDPPVFDDYITLCAADTIKRKKPNITLIHLCDLDTTKHRNRIDSPETRRSLERLDERVGQIIKASIDAGIYQDSVVLVLGDHGQFNVDYRVHLNNLLMEAGLIYMEEGLPKWRAYLQATGGNAFLHIQENDKDAEIIAVNVLTKAMKDGQFGIEAIYSRDTLDILHAHLKIRYVVEGKPGYHFDDELADQTIVNYADLGIKYATHGFSPEKPKYKCILIAAGKCIKKGYDIGPADMVDIAPTITEILGIRFDKYDGKPLKDIFI